MESAFRMDAAGFAGIRPEPQQPRDSAALGFVARVHGIWRNDARVVRRRQMRASVLGLLLALQSAAASAADPWEKIPPKASARVNPLAADANTIAAGAKLFEEHCA